MVFRFERSVPDANRRDKWWGLTIIAASFVGSLGISLWAKHESTPKPPVEPAPPSQERVSGFPSAVRPFDVLERARELTPRTQFRGFVAEGVRPDGTLDFANEKSKLRLSFQSKKGEGPQPLRQGGTLPTRTFCGKQDVRVSKDGIFAEPDVTDLPCAKKEPKNLKPPAACSLEQVWEVAKKRGVAEDAWARVEFFESRKGSAYRFFHNGKQRFVVSAKDCEKLLRGKDEQGEVP